MSPEPYLVAGIAALLGGITLWCCWMAFIEKPDWLWEDTRPKR